MIEREYYSIEQAASLLGCTKDDLIHLAACGRVRLGVLFGIDEFFKDEHYDAFDINEMASIPVPSINGFVYVDRGYFKDMERVGGDLIFNAVLTKQDVMLSTKPSVQYSDSRSIDQIYIQHKDLKILRELEQSQIDAQNGTVRVSDNTLVATIAALLASWPGGKLPSGKDLEKAASSVGVPVSDDSIRKALKLAYEIAPSLKSA